MPHYDEQAATREAQRIDDLKHNNQYQRGIALAHEVEKKNRREEVEQGLKDLARVAQNRDSTQAGRDCYDRKHRSVLHLVQRYVTAYKETISLPAWAPPPTPADTDQIVIGPIEPAATDGTYRETHGLGKSGKGLPPECVEGSLAWLQRQPK